VDLDGLDDKAFRSLEAVVNDYISNGGSRSPLGLPAVPGSLDELLDGMDPSQVQSPLIVSSLLTSSLLFSYTHPFDDLRSLVCSTGTWRRKRRRWWRA